MTKLDLTRRQLVTGSVASVGLFGVTGHPLTKIPLPNDPKALVEDSTKDWSSVECDVRLRRRSTYGSEKFVFGDIELRIPQCNWDTVLGSPHRDVILPVTSSYWPWGDRKLFTELWRSFGGSTKIDSEVWVLVQRCKVSAPRPSRDEEQTVKDFLISTSEGQVINFGEAIVFELGYKRFLYLLGRLADPCLSAWLDRNNREVHESLARSKRVTIQEQAREIRAYRKRWCS